MINDSVKEVAALPSHARVGRSGTIYITVLMTSLIVATFAIATSLVSYRTQKDRVIHDEAFDLATAAESAIDLALARIASDPNWRVNHASNQEYGPFTLGRCNVFYRLIDSTNNLAANTGKDITIIGVARQNNASYAVSVRATPNGSTFTCIQHSVASASPLDLSNANHWNTHQRFFFNGPVSLSGGSTLTGDTLSAGAIIVNTPSLARGSRTQFQTSITIPQISYLENIYKDLATAIPVTSLPNVGGVREIKGQVISPNINPFLTGTNIQGIYSIDCQGQTVSISNSRIIGTLLLINTGDASQIGANTIIEPALPNYPSLIVKGKMGFATRFAPFTESSPSINCNLNPPEAPLGSLSNNSLTESYVPEIKGIVYVSNDANLLSGYELQIDGIFIANRIVANSPGTLRVFYNNLPTTSPPPGFRSDARMQPVSGTYRRIPTP